MNVNDERDSYLLSLKALELASDRVQAACQGDDIKAAAIEAHFGLHAVYDLHEAYFRPRKIAGYPLQDQVLDVTGGWAVGGLALARGQRTHHLVTFPRTGGFGNHPHGMGPYGPGWIWKQHSWSAPEQQQRAAWYEARVSMRLLWVPLDEAWKWFVDHVDDESGAKLLGALGLEQSSSAPGKAWGRPAPHGRNSVIEPARKNAR